MHSLVTDAKEGDKIDHKQKAQEWVLWVYIRYVNITEDKQTYVFIDNEVSIMSVASRE